MAKKIIHPYPDKLEIYEQLIASNSNLERKGAKMPYTSMNGHMFTFLSPEGDIALRLSKDDREAFIEKHNTQLMEQHGRVMKEYVKVPSGLLGNMETLVSYLGKSYDYVKSLKPKPTKKKAK